MVQSRDWVCLWYAGGQDSLKHYLIIRWVWLGLDAFDLDKIIGSTDTYCVYSSRLAWFSFQEYLMRKIGRYQLPTPVASTYFDSHMPFVINDVCTIKGLQP